ncbi:MAG: helix-turn-helix domain-containing protein [Thermaerobacter sp.]|nr:helix-turn-helix domain-containing protein [Thermaerobacter sp.]
MAVEGVRCPVARTAEIVGGKWTLLILRDLCAGERRFSELQRSLDGISPKTLAERLRFLERNGVVRRAARGGVPGHVAYSLTPLGEGLQPVIESLRNYGEHWLREAKRPS